MFFGRLGLSMVLIEGYNVDEILALPAEQLHRLILTDDTLIIKVGSATILGRFRVSERSLVLELGHIEGGGEGVLPTLGLLASRFAVRERLEFIEWRVHAVHCAKPNLKLRRVLERRGFVVRDIEGVGECYWLNVPVEQLDSSVVFEQLPCFHKNTGRETESHPRTTE